MCLTYCLKISSRYSAILGKYSTKFDVSTNQVMDNQIHVIGKAIRPFFGDPVPCYADLYHIGQW